MKHMKKSMFITTLAMVVVLVVALSTATFAWYSASTTVAATATDLMSASSSSAAIALDKTAVTSSSTGTKVTFTATTGTIAPMIPTVTPSVGSTTYSAFVASFKSAGIDTHNYFIGEVTGASPSTISTVSIDGGASSEQAYFYVGNTNPGANPTIQMSSTIQTTGNIYVLTATSPADWSTNYTAYYTKNGNNYTAVTGDSAPSWAADTYYKSVAINSNLAGCLRIAIFIDDTYAVTYATSGAATNVGHTTNMAAEAYAQYDSNHTNETGYGIAAQYNATAMSTPTTVKACTAVDSAKVQWVAWFDGCQLISDYAGYAVQFTFTFSVA